MGSENSSFFFIRHGQTDFNRKELAQIVKEQASQTKSDQISLNLVGIKQAQKAKKLIDLLNIEKVFFSPLPRAVETKEILFQPRLNLQEYVISEFKECTFQVWLELRQMKHLTSVYSGSKSLQQFVADTHSGLEKILLHSGEKLIVAHGGVFRALCLVLGIADHIIIKNAQVIHFCQTKDGWEFSLVQ